VTAFYVRVLVPHYTVCSFFHIKSIHMQLTLGLHKLNFEYVAFAIAYIYIVDGGRVLHHS
jgi:hypothetical protein